MLSLHLHLHERQRDIGPIERADHVSHEMLLGEGLLDEVVLDVLVLETAQEHGPTRCERTTGTADLLVVADRGTRRLEVEDEREVGLVVAHPERDGGDQRLHVVAEEPILCFELVDVVELAVVREHVVAPRGEPGCDVVGVAHRQAVDDARPVDALEFPIEPCEPLGLAVESDRAESETVTPQRSAENGQVSTQLDRHVVDHTIVRGCRASEYGHVRLAEPFDHATDPPVVGSEVVAPVGDAVHLVDHDRARVDDRPAA